MLIVVVVVGMLLVTNDLIWVAYKSPLHFGRVLLLHSFHYSWVVVHLTLILVVVVVED